MRRTLLFGALGAILVTALWWFLFFRPVSARIDDAQTQLEAARSEETTLQTQVARLRKVRDNQVRYLQAIGALESAIPPTPELHGLIDDLSQLARDSGVEWKGVTFSLPEEAEDGPYNVFTVDIDVSGQYFEILGYLYGIAEMDRIVRIDGIGLSPTEDEQGFTVLDADISGVAFTTGAVTVPDLEAASTDGEGG